MPSGATVYLIYLRELQVQPAPEFAFVASDAATPAMPAVTPITRHLSPMVMSQCLIVRRAWQTPLNLGMAVPN